ncbi:ribonucleases P/MRP protein subunit POP1-like isoform X2 [Oncorhynchus kisutch]|uniref:ribonucleases P/MRP protein subunit POP1-like isoform X2 n=1 Tax=Oncorhynchus kisutch TaxID=8019 RepID=UPI0012DF468C|nr:ribonucleases P/MRP protein subunit POP1-like isoform X2 [Oncorhynchus kisutch]
MSTAKHRMRDKKMRNQPINVTYSSQGSSHWRNGGGTPTGRGHDLSPHPWGHGSSHSGHAQGGGWVRGHQREGHGGYPQALPTHITASAFAKARAAEVNAMLMAVTKTTGSSHVFGGLPKHMRRRAMSHNTKRLPCRLRDMANNMLEKSQKAGQKMKKEQSKSKSRKARRRHGNMLLEFNRRQRKNLWLETHIWHAKRFHVVKRWGYCLGDRPTYKCYRACYRAMSSHCLLQDLLPELQAVCQCSEAVLPPAPVDLPVPQPAPTPTLAPGPGAGPEAAQTSGSGSKRKWSSREPEAAGPPAKKLLGYSTISATTPVTWRSSTTGIVISDLTMEMVRYRLIGPLSHSVLTETLAPATHTDATGKSRPSPFWWPDHCRDDCNMSLHQQQAGVFNMLRGVYSTAEVPAGSVLGLTVDDPRLTLPNKRSKAVSDIRKAQGVNEERRRELMLKGIPEPLSQSSLWDRSVRDNVTHNKMTDQEVNRLRNDVLVPGSRLPTPLQGRVPVLLVQQSGKSQGTEMGSWGAGWDLLLPKAWGMAFWVPLVYRGVRIGGLRMSLKHTQNKGEPHFPHDYPDCPAGARFQEEQEAELLAKFRRRPPAKRTNYIKHGCLAPFRCPWQQLVEEWELIVKEEEGGGGEDAVVPMEQEVTPPQSNFTVLRNRKSLRQLSAWCRPTSSKCQRARNPGSTPQLNRNVAASLLSSHGGSSLVWIRLSLVTKGQPEQHALVCVPTAEDLQLVRKEPGCTGPQEPLHTDHFKSRVKRPRKKDHNKPGTSSSSSAKQSDPASVPGVNPGPDPSSSSSLTNPSSSCTSAPSVNPDPSSSSSLTNPSSSCTSAPSVNPDPSSSSSLTNPSSSCTSAPSVNPDPSSSSSLTNPSSSCTSALTLGLWPEPLPSVTSHCSRVTLGWVTQGDFSLSAGCGEALGLLSLTGLLHTLLRQPDGQRGLVLLRNPGSLQYRFAKINIEV